MEGHLSWGTGNAPTMRPGLVPECRCSGLATRKHCAVCYGNGHGLNNALGSLIQTGEYKRMSGYYELKTTASGKQMFNLKAGNHEVILTSQFYDSVDAAMEGIAAVRKSGQEDSSYERKESAKGEPYFVLKSDNGQIVGKSEMYKSVSGRDNGIASVVRNCASDKVVEAESDS